MKQSYWEKLELIERLARGNVWNRFLSDPLRYIAAVGYWRLIYPLKKKGRFVSASTFFGPEMHLILPSATEIFLFGAKTHDSEIRLARFLMKELQTGDLFCDVGAHFGYFSLLASKLVGDTGKVISFEASKSTFEIFQKNTASKKNIITENQAASDTTGVLTFHEFPALFSEYNSLIKPSGKHANWINKNPANIIEIPAIPLDQYFKDLEAFPKIIKIDVEGAEPQVLNGLSEMMMHHAPTLVMEYLTEGSQNNAHQEAVKFATEKGYSTFIISKTGAITTCSDIEQSMKLRKLTSDNIIMQKMK